MRSHFDDQTTLLALTEACAKEKALSDANPSQQAHLPIWADAVRCAPLGLVRRYRKR